MSKNNLHIWPQSLKIFGLQSACAPPDESTVGLVGYCTTSAYGINQAPLHVFNVQTNANDYNL